MACLVNTGGKNIPDGKNSTYKAPVETRCLEELSQAQMRAEDKYDGRQAGVREAGRPAKETLEAIQSLSDG